MNSKPEKKKWFSLWATKDARKPTPGQAAEAGGGLETPGVTNIKEASVTPIDQQQEAGQTEMTPEAPDRDLWIEVRRSEPEGAAPQFPKLRSINDEEENSSGPNLFGNAPVNQPGPAANAPLNGPAANASGCSESFTKLGSNHPAIDAIMMG